MSAFSLASVSKHWPPSDVESSGSRPRWVPLALLGAAAIAGAAVALAESLLAMS
jgi:hypothetical protein